MVPGMTPLPVGAEGFTDGFEAGVENTDGGVDGFISGENDTGTASPTQAPIPGEDNKGAESNKGSDADQTGNGSESQDFIDGDIDGNGDGDSNSPSQDPGRGQTDSNDNFFSQDPVAAVQEQINALPDAWEITEENLEAVIAQLDAIDEGKAALTEEETARLDFTRYDETADAVMALTGMESGGTAAFAAVGMSKPPIGRHTIGVREVDAYEISTKEQLYWFANAVNTSETILDYNAVLMNDITVNRGVLDKNGNLNSGNFVEWTPIGTGLSKEGAFSEEHEYHGRFDGHAIR